MQSREAMCKQRNPGYRKGNRTEVEREAKSKGHIAQERLETGDRDREKPLSLWPPRNTSHELAGLTFHLKALYCSNSHALCPTPGS